MMKAYHMTEEYATKWAQERARSIRSYRQHVDMLEIDFSTHRTDGEIIAEISREVVYA
jgi:hypothetical protein